MVREEYISEKHRPSGVDRIVHRKEDGHKVDYDHVKNLPKYNKHQEFRQASKFQRVTAREVTNPDGEYLDTVLDNGQVERKGTHIPCGYFILKNVSSSEQWGIDPKTFAKKYEPDPEQEGVYKPKGGPMNASNPIKRNMTFSAPWGGEMYMKKGARILQDPTNKKDTYGIGGEEFDKTYRFNESRLRKIVKEEIEKTMHFSNDRRNRINAIEELGGYGKSVCKRVVDRGHPDGPEIFVLTDNAIIKVYNANTLRHVTDLIARPEQIIDRLGGELSKLDKDLLVNIFRIAKSHQARGYNFR